MARFGELEFPDELLNREYALALLREYVGSDAWHERRGDRRGGEYHH